MALARDLRDEFYPYFAKAEKSFLKTLIRLLDTKEPDQLEWTLVCLAYLFKILKPFLKKDVSVVFDALIPLLNYRNPEHVTNFAAECFSFVARDIKDKEKFLSIILSKLAVQIDDELKQSAILTRGCGQLLFEIVHGVNDQFHSCAELYLRVYFDAFSKIKATQLDLLYDVLSETVTSLMKQISPMHMHTFWNACYQSLELFIQNKTETKNQAINQLLLLMGMALETRDGKFLTNPSGFVTVLLKVIEAPHINEKNLQCISEVVAVLLLSKNLNLTQLDASRISKRVLTLPYPNIFESFVLNCVNYVHFEMLLLPEFLRYLDSEHFSVNALELLAKIISIKAPLVCDGFTLPEKKTYPFRMHSEKCLRKIQKKITSAPENELFLEEPREVLLSTIVYPHIKGVEPTDVMNKINKLTGVCLDALKSNNPEVELENSVNRIKNQQIIFTLSILVESQIQLIRNADGKRSHIKNEISLRKLVEKLLAFCRCENYRYIHALRLLDLIITFEKNQTKGETSAEFNTNLFYDIHKMLSNNLSSRYHIVRRTTAHLFDQFADVVKTADADQSIYSVFFAVESIEPTIHSYREQLLLLQKIEPTSRFLSSLPSQIKYDPLKYLLGSLYVNFKLLWKPVMELIAEYFNELDIEEFWALYKAKIDETTVQQCANAPESDNQIDLDFLQADSCLSSHYTSIWSNEERPADLVNYRILLWQIIPSLGMLREIKNREIVTIFLDFIEHEFKKATDRDSLTWNAQRKRKQNKLLPAKENDVQSDDEENADDTDKVEEQIVTKGTQRTLITMLQVFTNQNNPKQLHREPELWSLYLELLSHRNSAVQKLALDCIVAYKHKYILPYKEHLYNMVDDAKFKDAIANFKIDKESNLLQAEHRPQLMPLVMRILFRKMLMRAAGQKTPNQLRKSLVMRFLGGCHEEEILIMLNMSFWMFENDFKEDVREMCLNVMTKTSPTTILSPSILQSSLDLLDVIQSEFSGLMSNTFLRYIINVLLVIGSLVQSMIQQSKQSDSNVSNDMAKPFKHLRHNCIQNLQRFFEHFDSYPWSDNEIDAIFLIFVTPSADKLPQESLLSVTPLLKLITTFAKTPRLFVLLTRYTNITSNSEDTTPLRYIMDLLTEPKARPLVCLSIMESIQSLLTYIDDVNENVKPLEITQCKAIDTKRLQDIPNADNLNLGSKILLPYLPKILEKFKINLKKRRGLTKRDLAILSKITELITDAETSHTLLTVLLPILVRKSNSSAGEETLVQMVNTIINLFKRIERPERHIRNIAPMFEQITAVGPRKLLCQLLQIVYERCADEQKVHLKKLVEIVKELNALDRRWVEQPDYEKRLGAYKKISELVANEEIDLNLGLLIVYHSFHFIKFDKDMALRDSASHHLKTLVPALIRKLQKTSPQELEYFIGTVILNLVRRTLRDKNDNVRNEGILLLGEMARECPDAHPVLFDLNALTCKQDREIDFFDNITHLQSLRHGRALLRFGTVAKTLDRLPNPRTLTQFILPLASMYIASEKYAAKHGIVTSAIETIGAVCHLLPWHQYESILKYYIKNMRYSVQYQKQMVRIVMQILDAFHFDLSKANVKVDEINVPTEIDEKPTKTKKKELEQKKDETTVNVTQDEDAEEEEIIGDADANSDVENFDEELDALNHENGGQEKDDDDAEIVIKKVKICVYDQLIVLPQSLAKKIVHSLASQLIPTLNNSITALSTYEIFHKLNKKKRRSEREEEEILRVPIALAVVKLLQKLPAGMLGKICIICLPTKTF